MQENLSSGLQTVRLKPVFSAAEISWKIEISPVASTDMSFYKRRITKALIRLRGCTVWSASWLFASPEDRFSGVEAHIGQLMRVW